jgi:hypothetical protein
MTLHARPSEGRRRLEATCNWASALLSPLVVATCFPSSLFQLLHRPLCTRHGLTTRFISHWASGTFAHSQPVHLHHSGPPRMPDREVGRIRAVGGRGVTAPVEVRGRCERPREMRHERHSRLSGRRGRAARRAVGAWAWACCEADVTKCVRGCGRGGRSVQRTEGGAILIDVQSGGWGAKPHRARQTRIGSAPATILRTIPPSRSLARFSSQYDHVCLP